jgi:hypothetical protein
MYKLLFAVDPVILIQKIHNLSIKYISCVKFLNVYALHKIRDDPMATHNNSGIHVA